MGKQESASNRLSQAAEELAKAAIDQTEGIIINIQREIAGNILDLKKESIALKSDTNNKLKTVNQNLQDLQKNQSETKKSVDALLKLTATISAQIAEKGKMSRIQNAIESIDRSDKVDLYESGSNHGVISSVVVIKRILFNFSRGAGYVIDDYIDRTSYNPYNNISSKEKEERKLKARIALGDAVHSLIGKAPEIAPAASGKWTMWYE